MDLLIVLPILIILVIGIAVGIGVSMDVSGFNLSKAGDKKYSSRPVKHSLLHAFWHALFLSIGIGLVELFALAFEWLMIKYDMTHLLMWVTDLIPWLEPLKFPIWILAIIGVALWIKLYWDKIRGADDEEFVPNWLKWILNLFRVPVGQLSYVLVAVDMWFLTPLLKSVIEDYPLYGKIAFVATVFITVFTCSMVSIRYGQRLLASQNKKTLFYWLVTLVWAEPLITGYFAARATWWTFTGIMENNTSLVFASMFCVALLCFGKFTEIIEDKWIEAEETTST